MKGGYRIKKEILPINERPLPHELVKVKDMGNITELVYMKKHNNQCKIQKLDSENYILLDTGEIKQFEHLENRADDLNSVRCSLSRLRDYLNTNITDTFKCRWVTLTYGENMTDTKKLYSDFKKFNMRLRYLLGHYEYIVAYEPQSRGAWHMHVVMIFEHTAPFISNDVMFDAWGHGFVTVKRLDDVDNVGAYLTAYLGDMELSENEKYPANGTVKEVPYIDETGQQKLKRYIKGARLFLYPPKFNLYSCSRGIKKPIVSVMESKKAQKKISADTLTFERTVKLYDDTGFTNTINYRYYNKVRSKKQDGKNDN